MNDDWQSVPCKLWTDYKDKAGYGRRSNHKRDGLVHRRAWEDANGPIPPGMQVCHHCDTPSCFEAKHLFLGTMAANQKDKVSKGRQSRGAGRPDAKLSDNDAAAIRKRYVPRDPVNGGRAMAREYGVSQTVIASVTQGRTWKHVGG